MERLNQSPVVVSDKDAKFPDVLVVQLNPCGWEIFDDVAENWNWTRNMERLLDQSPFLPIFQKSLVVPFNPW